VPFRTVVCKKTLARTSPFSEENRLSPSARTTLENWGNRSLHAPTRANIATSPTAQGDLEGLEHAKQANGSGRQPIGHCSTSAQEKAARKKAASGRGFERRSGLARSISAASGSNAAMHTRQPSPLQAQHTRPPYRRRSSDKISRTDAGRDQRQRRNCRHGRRGPVPDPRSNRGSQILRRGSFHSFAAFLVLGRKRRGSTSAHVPRSGRPLSRF
jgi:hypothetical protein